MKTAIAPEVLWTRAGEWIAQNMGLNFPPERWPDLRRGLTRAAKDFGLADDVACAEWLLAATPTESEQRLLASWLTVGETYFFRERKSFDALAGSVLPQLMMRRPEGMRRLRVWSAGCCTGEEAYSLAILLSEVIPPDWHVTILATDINEHFVRRATEGIYGDWSFRETPPDFRQNYFRKLPDGRHALLPRFRRRVTFAYLNLAADVFPALATDTNAMDIIFCRNVLMYFTPAQARKVIANLRRALVDGGWLVVSPAEASQALFSEFAVSNFPGAILYQRDDAKLREARKEGHGTRIVSSWMPASSPSALIDLRVPPVRITPAPEVLPAPKPEKEKPAAGKIAAERYAEGRYDEVVETLLPPLGEPATAEEYSLLSRALANLGQLDEARQWCGHWLAFDKLNAGAHYLQAMILQELGDPAEARRSLQRAIYLEPKQVLAHFALGNLARAGSSDDEARRHFANALKLLGELPAEEVLPESDGLSAGRLGQVITSLLNAEVTA